MGEIKAYRKTHWVAALDADLANIPNPAVGDTVLTEDKKKLYYWQGGAWKTGLGHEFVSRSVMTGDIRINTLTRDNAWHYNGIDLSGIIPAGAVAALIYFSLKASAANKNFVLGGDIQVYAYDALNQKTQLANVDIYREGKTFIDTDRLIDYICEAADADGWITVKGWYI